MSTTRGQKTVIEDPGQAVVAYLLHRNRGAGVTRLMKLVFLAELEHQRRFGRPLSGLCFKSWHYGPYSEQVSSALDELQGRAIVHEKHVCTGDGHDCRLLELKKRPELWWVPPTPRAQEVLDEVIDKWEKRSTAEIVRHAKSTAQYVAAGFGETIRLDQCQPAPFTSPEDIDMDALVPDFV